MGIVGCGTETVSADVLIVGGGLAAMAAALEASEAGASVLIACKKNVGSSGATLMAAGNFAAALSESLEDKDAERAHLEDTVNEGWGINDISLVRTLTEKAPDGISFLEKHGVQFIKREGRFDLNRPPGHSRARTIFTRNSGHPATIRGRTITDPLRNALDKERVRILNGVLVFRLLIIDGRIAGAVGLREKTAEIVRLSSSAVIIAGGGAGGLFDRNTNPADLTGDSYTLALEAGCTLRDMEFVQFFPCMHRSSPRLVITSPTLSCGGVLRNKDSERFMERYDPERMEMATRDLVSQAIYRELKEGRGEDDCVYLDLTSIPAELFSLRFSDLISIFSKQGVNLRKQWIKVTPAAHFCMGGCVVNSRCQTSVAGLFVAGEAAGGLHGANRLSGNGLSEALVFGRIAGQETVSFWESNRGRNLASQPIDSLLPFGENTLSKKELVQMKKSVKELNWKKVGIVRNGSELKEAIEELGSMKGHLDQGCPDSIAALRHFFEVRSMVLTSLAVARAALAREESRGAHFREDFQKSDPSMKKAVLVDLEGNEIVATVLSK